MNEKLQQHINRLLLGGKILVLAEVRKCSAELSPERTDAESGRVTPARYRLDLGLEVGEGAFLTQLDARLSLPKETTKAGAEAAAKVWTKGKQGLFVVSAIKSEFGRIQSVSLTEAIAD